MSYLLMQIFLCLLIAGFIGLTIGWFLRGGCKNKLLDKNKKSSLKLNENNDRWSKRIEMEKNKNANTMKILNQELSEVKETLRLSEIKNRGSQTIKEQTKIRLKDMEKSYSQKLTQISKELSITKQQLAIVIKETHI